MKPAGTTERYKYAEHTRDIILESSQSTQTHSFLKIKMADDACSQRPPVSADYTPTGHYETIAGLKTCKSHLPFSHRDRVASSYKNSLRRGKQTSSAPPATPLAQSSKSMTPSASHQRACRARTCSRRRRRR